MLLTFHFFLDTSLFLWGYLIIFREKPLSKIRILYIEICLFFRSLRFITRSNIWLTWFASPYGIKRRKIRFYYFFGPRICPWRWIKTTFGKTMFCPVICSRLSFSKDSLTENKKKDNYQKYSLNFITYQSNKIYFLLREK